MAGGPSSWLPGSLDPVLKASSAVWDPGLQQLRMGWNVESGGDHVLCTWLGVQASPLSLLCGDLSRLGI